MNGCAGSFSIRVIFDENERTRIKSVIRIINEGKEESPILKVRSGIIGESGILVLEVKEANYHSVLTKLLLNKVKILSRKPEDLELIAQINEELEETWQTGSKPAPASQMSIKEFRQELTKAVLKGDFELVIKYARTEYSKQFQTEAKNVIDSATSIAVEEAYFEGRSSVDEAKKAIDKLVFIAGHHLLKTLSKIDLMKKAGAYAIELCCSRQELFARLLEIANNSQVYPSIPIRAALKFWQLLQDNSGIYERNLELAEKKLNVLSLVQSFNLIHEEFNATESKCFLDLVGLVQNRHSIASPVK